VKLLLDQNLSPRIVDGLPPQLEGSTHVRNVGLSAASDQAVWDFASERGFTVVSKDGDFHQMSFLYGAPPKVVWLRIGNCTTEAVADLLRSRTADLLSFLAQDEATFLILE
jgi:predicted nuclease of predicted toxin-antitoxin system